MRTTTKSLLDPIAFNVEVEKVTMYYSQAMRAIKRNYMIDQEETLGNHPSRCCSRGRANS